jgi:hypothetical protein
MDDEDHWDHGELPHAVLNLENQTALSECSLLLQLTVVERRSLDETKESRAVALREVLLELLAKELDHPYCSALRALAGLEPGTAGRNRERRQQVAGAALGTERHPATTRTVRPGVRPWGCRVGRLPTNGTSIGQTIHRHPRSCHPGRYGPSARAIHLGLTWRTG